MALLNKLRNKNARLAVVRATPGCTQLSSASAEPYSPNALTNYLVVLAIATATIFGAAACAGTIDDEESDTELDVDTGAGIDHPVYVPEDGSAHQPLDRGAVADTMDDDAVPTISAAEDDAASLLDDAASVPADDVADWVINPNDGDQDEGGEEGDEMNEELGDLTGAVASDDATPSGTSTTEIPSKIRYVLVIVKENRTFDNYFTGFPGADWATWAYKWNSKTGKDEHFKRPFAPDGTLPNPPKHTHAKALAAYRDGHMDGFSVNVGKTPYMRYHESQLANYWKYARDYVLADHYFSTTLAPSAPGHEVFWFSRSTTLDNGVCHKTGGTGCGHGCEATRETVTTFNPTTGVEHKVKPCFNLPSLPDHLPDWIRLDRLRRPDREADQVAGARVGGSLRVDRQAARRHEERQAAQPDDRARQRRQVLRASARGTMRRPAVHHRRDQCRDEAAAVETDGGDRHVGRLGWLLRSRQAEGHARE